jgi:hypothetical protein
VPSQQTLDADRQLGLYQLGVEARYGTATRVRLVWHYLQRDQVRISTRSPDQLGTLRRDTIERIEQIEAEREFAPRPSALCTWCEHNDVCPAARPSPPRQPTPIGEPASEREAFARSPQAAEGERGSSGLPVPRRIDRAGGPMPPPASGPSQLLLL